MGNVTFKPVGYGNGDGFGYGDGYGYGDGDGFGYGTVNRNHRRSR